jgi:hypothetical protein
MMRDRLSMIGLGVVRLVVSFIVAVAITRFLNRCAGAVPDWAVEAMRSAAVAMGDPSWGGVEDIMDADFLGRIVVSWLLAVLGMVAASRCTRGLIRSSGLSIACGVGTSVVALFAAYRIYGLLAGPTATGWLHDRLVTPDNAMPDPFQVAYVAALLMGCWMGVLVCVRVTGLGIRRYGTRNRRTAEE